MQSVQTSRMHLRGTVQLSQRRQRPVNCRPHHRCPAPPRRRRRRCRPAPPGCSSQPSRQQAPAPPCCTRGGRCMKECAQRCATINACASQRRWCTLLPHTAIPTQPSQSPAQQRVARQRGARLGQPLYHKQRGGHQGAARCQRRQLAGVGGGCNGEVDPPAAAAGSAARGHQPAAARLDHIPAWAGRQAGRQAGTWRVFSCPLVLQHRHAQRCAAACQS